ncbi:MAG: protein-export chaperone SecB, partial [Pseudomonadota bacterium]
SEQVNEEVHEVTLKVNITATSEKGTVYIVELDYCGLAGIRNIGEDQTHAFLFAEAPRILFPFARRIVADAVRDAGFPPLLLDPIDFNALYLQQLQAKRAQEEAAGGAITDTPEGSA